MRLGDLDALKEEMNRPFWEKWEWEFICKSIDNATTIDNPYQEGHIDGMLQAEKLYARSQGEWIIDGHHIRCNRCNEYICDTDREGNKIPDNFCPNCGAFMQKGGKTNEEIV